MSSSEDLNKGLPTVDRERKKKNSGNGLWYANVVNVFAN